MISLFANYCFAIPRLKAAVAPLDREDTSRDVLKRGSSKRMLLRGQPVPVANANAPNLCACYRDDYSNPNAASGDFASRCRSTGP
jgi:hypothetical protein